MSDFASKINLKRIFFSSYLKYEMNHFESHTFQVHLPWCYTMVVETPLNTVKLSDCYQSVLDHYLFSSLIKIFSIVNPSKNYVFPTVKNNAREGI